MLPISQIYPNPNQPRKIFAEQPLEELAASIRIHGVLQAITVRPDGSGRFMVCCGERRLRAAQLAGLSEIPAEVVNLSDSELAEVAIIENLNRQDISPLEEARAFQAMVDGGYTAEELAKRLGVNVARVKQRLSLLDLEPQYLDVLAKDGIDVGFAYELSRLKPENQHTLFGWMRDGKLHNMAKVKAAATGLRNAENQTSFFAEEQGPTAEEREKVSRLERTIEQVSGLLQQGFKEGELVICHKINPMKAAVYADQLLWIGKSIGQLENALRICAAQFGITDSTLSAQQSRQAAKLARQAQEAAS